MSYQTPLSKLANHLRIKRDSMNQVNAVDATCTAASQRIEQLENKLSSTIAHATSMAQELQEIIGDAETAGCENPIPTSQALVDLWEALYQEQNLINEVAL
jgi:small-conductance mechanosensitive channel